MPTCINNKNKTYIGNEHSPLGIGYSAESENIGTKMHGLDKKIYIVKQYGNMKYWILYDKRPGILIKKLLPEWKKLANGGLLAICENNTYRIFENDVSIPDTDIKLIWHNLAENFSVKAIIWSSLTIDTLYNFVRYIVYNCSTNRINNLLKTKNIFGELIKDYEKYFIKYKLKCKKDYTFKQEGPIL